MLCSCGKMEKNLTLGKEGKATSGVWITFSEINNMLSSQNGFQKELAATIENCKQLNIENVYIHVRSYCDSLFKSEYFPLTEKAKGYDYDIFSAFLDAFHNENIKVHAWINPYRVTNKNIEELKMTKMDYLNTLSERNFARKNPDLVLETSGHKLILDPASSAVQE